MMLKETTLKKKLYISARFIDFGIGL